MLSVAMAEKYYYTIILYIDIIFLMVKVIAGPFSPAEVYYHKPMVFRFLKPLHEGGFCGDLKNGLYFIFYHSTRICYRFLVSNAY